MYKVLRTGLCVIAALVLMTSGLIAGVMQAKAQPPQDGVPILVYHRFGATVMDSMTVRTETFEQQIAWLKENGYQIIPLRLLLESLRNPQLAPPPHAVVITVDDGHRSVYTEMLPVIRRERIPVTLFIYPSAISNADYALTWEQLKEMSGTGLVDVQSHTYWHPNFHHEAANRDPKDYEAFVRKQFLQSQATTDHQLGGTVDLLAWPFGIYDTQLEQWARDCGYIAAFTLERRGAAKGDDLMALPRFLITDADRGARFAALIERGERYK